MYTLSTVSWTHTFQPLAMGTVDMRRRRRNNTCTISYWRIGSILTNSPIIQVQKLQAIVDHKYQVSYEGICDPSVRDVIKARRVLKEEEDT